jgi:hypothetical protein
MQTDKNYILIKNIFYIAFLSVLYSLNINAQEILIPLMENPAIKTYQKKHSGIKNLKVADTLELPFLDDFSTSYLYPDANLWADSFAFVNNSYPDSPPSIGVATLDAIDDKGNFYQRAGYEISFTADYLSSKPINLDYPGDQSIYLSFYYQPQGLGDNPEEKDSLILEFYDVQDSVWNKVWSKAGTTNQDFEQVIIHINDTKYLKKGFRFRFKNLASLSSASVPSKVGNVDHWHIDYVYLNKNRTANDLIKHDIAFVSPMYSFLADYSAMPWKHFLTDPAAMLKPNIEVVYRNNDNVNRLIERLDFIFKDNSGNRQNDTLEGGSSDMIPGLLVNYRAPYSYSFTTNTQDTVSFTITAKITTDDFDPLMNNEIHYLQKFYNYYAYDDGSAEVGYGLIGEGTKYAKLAYQFDAKMKDTLQSVQMYFNRTYNDAGKKYFYLTVWDDDGTGQPGKILYQKEGALPEYIDGLNQFHTYTLDTTLILQGKFYVGWIQTTEDLLNVGMDINTASNDKIFYNITGTWTKSKYEGSLMIRPVFGKSIVTALAKKPSFIDNINLKLYPNPVNDILNFRIGDEITEQLYIYVIDTKGNIIYKSSITEKQGSIDLSGYIQGVYFLKIISRTGKFNKTYKIIKQ